ncbi:MAG: serine hydrolase [bacterium]|nr:serine hydrolase [bacterium]
MSLESHLEALSTQLIEWSGKRGVVGAALAVGRGDELFEAAAGVVNRNTGVQATPDSVFQIGSITKLFTTTLIMQLVDDGLVELEAPVQSVLPEFQVADEKSSKEITLAQLLSHTSGMDGDYFLDTGPGDDCVERYVLACSALPQLHRPGQKLSYCNAGFVIAGRIVEKLRGKPWHSVLTEQILWPLGLFAMGTEPEQAILHRAAVGHIALGESGEASVIPIWRLSRSNGPAGATPFARARDLIPFSQLHLKGGLAPDGSRLLSAKSVAAMQERRFEMPPHAMTDGQGLGWMQFDWSGQRVIGHDGGTIGQASFLRIHPESGTIVSLLTTGGEASALYRDVFQEVLGELCGVSLPALPEESPTLEIPLSAFVGRYERLSTGYEVRLEEGGLVVSASGLKPPLSLLPAARTRLRAISRDTFVAETPSGLVRSPVIFSEFDAEGRPGYLEVGLRAAPRTGTERAIP